ncbi:Grm7 [Symbiodinium microadriaticum]|nr:Grm7 [Symbiodinium microadriaticum]
MTFATAGRGSNFEHFRTLWSRLTPDDIVGIEAREKYGLNAMREPLEDAAVANLGRERDMLAAGASSATIYAPLAFDAFYAFAVAISRLLVSGLSEADIRGDVLLAELRQTSFTGALF